MLHDKRGFQLLLSLKQKKNSNYEKTADILQRRLPSLQKSI